MRKGFYVDVDISGYRTRMYMEDSQVVKMVNKVQSIKAENDETVTRLLSDFSDSPDGATDVNPSHYSGDLVMRVIEARGLDFALGNAVKYVCRAGSKGDKLTDLKKALWYLERAIAKEEAAK